MTPSVFEWRAARPTIVLEKPKAQPVSMRAVRDYRMDGHTWAECAAHFDRNVFHLIYTAVKAYPELRGLRFGKRPGPRPRPLPVEQIAEQILAGESIRGAARQHGIPSPSLRARLLQTPRGAAAVTAARERANWGGCRYERI